MLLVDGASANPRSQLRHFTRRKWRSFRGHSLVVIRRGDSANQLARIWIAGDDRNSRVFGFGKCRFSHMKRDSTFMFRRPVAGKTPPRQQRLDITSKVDFLSEDGAFIADRSRQQNNRHRYIHRLCRGVERDLRNCQYIVCRTGTPARLFFVGQASSLSEYFRNKFLDRLEACPTTVKTGWKPVLRVLREKSNVWQRRGRGVILQSTSPHNLGV